MNGILLAHVFFNLPYASRLLLQALDTVPAEQYKSCAHLGMSHWNKFKMGRMATFKATTATCLWFSLHAVLHQFCYCNGSWWWSEINHYRVGNLSSDGFDFDLQAGALLAIWQMLLCGVLAVSIQRLSKPIPVTASQLF